MAAEKERSNKFCFWSFWGRWVFDKSGFSFEFAANGNNDCTFAMPYLQCDGETYPSSVSQINLEINEKSCYFCNANVIFRKMSHTKEPIVINNPSEKLLEAVKNLKERKCAQREKLRNMKPEDFSCRILL